MTTHGYGNETSHASKPAIVFTMWRTISELLSIFVSRSAHIIILPFRMGEITFTDNLDANGSPGGREVMANSIKRLPLLMDRTRPASLVDEIILV